MNKKKIVRIEVPQAVDSAWLCVDDVDAIAAAMGPPIAQDYWETGQGRIEEISWEEIVEAIGWEEIRRLIIRDAFGFKGRVAKQNADGSVSEYGFCF